MEAVYQLLEVDRGVPEVYASEFDARVLMDAYYQLNDRKSLPELVNKNFLKRSVLKKRWKKYMAHSLKNYYANISYYKSGSVAK